MDVFDSPEALAINRARMLHLESLKLTLAGKSVLDVGCGVGNLTRFFLERNCRVTCIDGRPENIETLKRRLPGVPAYVARVDTDPLVRLGRFDVVFCYGLLYHLENPVDGLRNLASVCDEFLLLETVVSDHELPVVRLLDEPGDTANQALGGLGCRPTPSFVAMALTRAGFGFVYVPVTPPSHPDFQFDWLNNLDCARDNHLLRCVFVASRRELENPQLQLLLSAPSGRKYPSSFLPPAVSPGRRIWLDVGAHLGEKSFGAAEKDPNLRVYAFEPNLCIGAQRMGQLPNFVVLPLAIAEQDGSAEFYVNAFNAASSLLPFVPEGLDRWIGKEQLRIERTISVPTIRLDTFMDRAGIQRVEFLKIDAQGADLAVVKSCGKRLRDIDRIQLEVQITPVPLYRNAAPRHEVVQYLESAGFELQSSEVQSQGQEENLVFVQWLNHQALAESRDLSFRAPAPSPRERRSPEWRALSGESALFDLRGYRVCNNSRVSGSGPVSVLTRPEQLSYALVFPIREKARRMIAPMTEIMVRMEAVVETGKIGIGIVSSDLSTYLLPEIQYDASQRTVDCEIVISHLPPDSALVVRNTAGDRVVSKAVIRSLATFVVRRD